MEAHNQLLEDTMSESIVVCSGGGWRFEDDGGIVQYQGFMVLAMPDATALRVQFCATTQPDDGEMWYINLHLPGNNFLVLLWQRTNGDQAWYAIRQTVTRLVCKTLRFVEAQRPVTVSGWGDGQPVRFSHTLALSRTD